MCHSLFNSLGIEGRLYSDFNDVDLKKLVNEKIDYTKVNQKILTLQKEGQSFLLKALETNSDRQEEKIKMKTEYAEKVYQQALANKNKVFLKYMRYKILSKVLFGKRRKKYKKKRKEYKVMHKRIKSILKKKGK